MGIFTRIFSNIKTGLSRSLPRVSNASCDSVTWEQACRAYTSINGRIASYCLPVTSLIREKAISNAVIQSYLALCTENIIGKSGFTLQTQLKNADGRLDQKLNDELEWLFYEWGCPMNHAMTYDGEGRSQGA